jgi:hypothetical protein
MVRVVVAFAIAAWTASAGAQVSPEYTKVGNDYGAEFAFAPGQPIRLGVEVEGVRFDTVGLTPQDEVRAGANATCEIAVEGSSVASKKATVTLVLLLEDDKGQGLQRVSAEPFRVKSSRAFSEKQRVEVPGDALSAASKVYIFIEIKS